MVSKTMKYVMAMMYMWALVWGEAPMLGDEVGWNSVPY